MLLYSAWDFEIKKQLVINPLDNMVFGFSISKRFSTGVDCPLLRAPMRSHTATRGSFIEVNSHTSRTDASANETHDYDHKLT